MSGLIQGLRPTHGMVRPMPPFDAYASSVGPARRQGKTGRRARLPACL